MSLMSKAPAGDGDASGGEGKTIEGKATELDNKDGGDAGAGGDDNTTDMSGNKDGDKDFKSPRPDDVPEKFWDAETGTVDTTKVLKSYSELEKQLTKAKEKPKAPENYEYKTPEKLREDFGIQESISEDDPYFSGYKKFAKENGLSQEQFQGFVDFYLETELSHARENMNAEFAKLGDERKAIERIKNIRLFGNRHLSKESQATLASLTNSAAAVKLFEELSTVSTKQRQPVDNDVKIDDALSEKQIDAMMNTEAYWDKKHPEYRETHRKVSEGLARLDTGKKR